MDIEEAPEVEADLLDRAYDVIDDLQDQVEKLQIQNALLHIELIACKQSNSKAHQKIDRQRKALAYLQTKGHPIPIQFSPVNGEPTRLDWAGIVWVHQSLMDYYVERINYAAQQYMMLMRLADCTHRLVEAFDQGEVTNIAGYLSHVREQVNYLQEAGELSKRPR